MAARVASSGRFYRELGAIGKLLIGKQMFNALAAYAAGAAERSRFAALPSRYLEDVGMTEGERAAVLGYDEPIGDGWQVVASHL